MDSARMDTAISVTIRSMDEQPDADLRWRLPGFVVERRLGSGPSGEVWRAREVATGDTVALKRVAPTPTMRGEGLRHTAAELAGSAGRHLAAVRSVLADGAGVAIVREYAARASLADRLTARGRQPAREVVRFAVPIAEALAELHGMGRCHGNVSPGNVLFDHADRPLLADAGLNALGGLQRVRSAPDYLDPAVADGAPLTPASDVHALAAVCFHALSGRAPRAAQALGTQGWRLPLGSLAPDVPSTLVDVVERALAVDPAERPAADVFGRMLAAVQLAPDELPRLAAQPPAREPARDVRRRRRRPGRGIGIAAASMAAVILAVVVGARWGSGGRPAAPVALPAPSARAAPSPPSPAPRPSLARSDWREVVTSLVAVRESAFRHPDAAVLTSIYSPGARPLASDTATLDQLRSAGWHTRGLVMRVRSVTLLSAGIDQADVRVVDELSAYDVVAADGHVIAHRTARPGRVVRLHLVTYAGQWRIAAVQPA